MTDDPTSNTTSGSTDGGSDAGEEHPGWQTDAYGSGSGTRTGREWIAQLQSMIENLAEQATPVVREVGAKAAELAALAGEKAGPVAHRAAVMTAEAGQKLALKSRDLAAELRRDQAADGTSAATGDVGTDVATDETITGDAP